MIDVIVQVFFGALIAYLVIGIAMALLAYWARGRHDTTMPPMRKVLCVVGIVLFWCPWLLGPMPKDPEA